MPPKNLHGIHANLPRNDSKPEAMSLFPVSSCLKLWARKENPIAGLSRLFGLLHFSEQQFKVLVMRGESGSSIWRGLPEKRQEPAGKESPGEPGPWHVKPSEGLETGVETDLAAAGKLVSWFEITLPLDAAAKRIARRPPSALPA
jgi:hypothetical protein